MGVKHPGQSGLEQEAHAVQTCYVLRFTEGLAPVTEERAEPRTGVAMEWGGCSVCILCVENKRWVGRGPTILAGRLLAWGARRRGRCMAGSGGL